MPICSSQHVPTRETFSFFTAWGILSGYLSTCIPTNKVKFSRQKRGKTVSFVWNCYKRELGNAKQTILHPRTNWCGFTFAREKASEVDKKKHLAILIHFKLKLIIPGFAAWFCLRMSFHFRNTGDCFDLTIILCSFVYIFNAKADSFKFSICMQSNLETL